MVKKFCARVSNATSPELRLCFMNSCVFNVFSDKQFKTFVTMKVAAEQARFKVLVENTISVLCQNSLKYEQEYTVEGLVVVTVDKKEAFHISIKDTQVKGDEDRQSATPTVSPSKSPVQSSSLRKRRSAIESDQEEKKVKSEEKLTRSKAGEATAKKQQEQAAPKEKTPSRRSEPVTQVIPYFGD